jgi:arabinan endo-1,5-alpha-L-arabinosidase
MDVGSWTDLGSTGVASSTGMSYNAIDGNLVNDNGNYFMTFGSFWQGIHRVRVTPTQKNGDVYQVAYDPSNTAMEGPNVFKYGSYYYLFFSKGQCCGYDKSRPASGKEYKIMVCRSTSAVGPFVDKSGNSCRNGGGTVVLASHNWVYGPGGQGVYQDPTYGPVSFAPFPPTPISVASCRLLTVLPGPVLPLRRHPYRVRRWPEEVWLEQDQLLDWLAGCLNRVMRDVPRNTSGYYIRLSMCSGTPIIIST